MHGLCHMYVLHTEHETQNSVLVSSPFWGPRLDFYYCQTFAGLLVWGVISDERTGLSFTTGPRQRNNSRVRVQRDSGTGFLFRRLLRLAGLRRRYSKPPPSGFENSESKSELLYRQSVRLGDKPLKAHDFFFTTEPLRS
jgi:hypothetical protein